ncbi:hypothetical protein DAEQUDRAFT_382609 [Daedalea quercina L-15889]|uniref:Uncharacterized protein n=1 Tax=Daedalea quercina L-15889 TaxID=1314783 RepID=A0A165P063_9APHY|nr:hypothetical protein DAEQUDRAFT_382609 [Daedalea quercina L-15889]
MSVYTLQKSTRPECRYTVICDTLPTTGSGPFHYDIPPWRSPSLWSRPPLPVVSPCPPRRPPYVLQCSSLRARTHDSRALARSTARVGGTAPNRIVRIVQQALLDHAHVHGEGLTVADRTPHVVWATRLDHTVHAEGLTASDQAPRVAHTVLFDHLVQEDG